MANFFKRLDKEKARQQDVRYQEYILTNRTAYIGFNGVLPDVQAEAFHKATTFQNLQQIKAVRYAPDPDYLFDNWETSHAIIELEEIYTSSE